MRQEFLCPQTPGRCSSPQCSAILVPREHASARQDSCATLLRFTPAGMVVRVDGSQSEELVDLAWLKGRERDDASGIPMAILEINDRKMGDGFGMPMVEIKKRRSTGRPRDGESSE